MTNHLKIEHRSVRAGYMGLFRIPVRPLSLRERLKVDVEEHGTALRTVRTRKILLQTRRAIHYFTTVRSTHRTAARFQGVK